MAWFSKWDHNMANEKEVFRFSLFEIVDVPFRWEGQTYVFDEFDVVVDEKGNREFRWHSEQEIPPVIISKLYQLIEAMYALPKAVMIKYAYLIAINELTFDKMFEHTFIYINDKCTLTIDTLTHVAQLMDQYIETNVRTEELTGFLSVFSPGLMDLCCEYGAYKRALKRQQEDALATAQHRHDPVENIFTRVYNRFKRHFGG